MTELLIALFAAALFCLAVFPARAEPSRCPYDIHLSVMYSFLSDAERVLFDRMYDALYEGRDTAAVPAGVSRDRAEWMLDFIYNEAPELCAYDRWASAVVSVPGGMEVRLKYKLPLSEQGRFIRSAAKEARRFTGLGESAGLRAIHDHLCARFEYGSVAGEDTQLAYFALKNSKAICNGYAQTFAMFGHFAGYTCSYIDGETYLSDGTHYGRHAWNIACAGGRYFWLDVTWDDQGTYTGSQWYKPEDTLMTSTHVPDGEYRPILDLKTVLPDRVKSTMHLDVNGGNGFSRGVTRQSGTSVRLAALSAGEYYSPAMVLWNGGSRPVKADVSYELDGRRGSWGTAEIRPGSNLPYRTDAEWLRDKTGSHRIVWYFGGIRIGVFTWRTE